MFFSPVMATVANVSDEKQAFIGLLGKKGTVVSDVSNASSSMDDVEMGKSRRKRLLQRTAPWIIVLLALGAIATLVSLEIIRSNELKKLRADVDLLKSRLLDEDFIDDLKAFEEEVSKSIFFFPLKNKHTNNILFFHIIARYQYKNHISFSKQNI